MELQRDHISISQLSDHADDNYVEASMEERIEIVWQLTKEACSISPLHDAEQRLQRHIFRVARTTS